MTWLKQRLKVWTLNLPGKARILLQPHFDFPKTREWGQVNMKSNIRSAADHLRPDYRGLSVVTAIYAARPRKETATMLKSLKVFSDRNSETISIIGPQKRRGLLFEVISWTGFDQSAVTGFDNKLEYARLFADAPRIKAENERLRKFAEYILTNGAWQGCGIEGGMAQDKAEELGLIELRPCRPEDSIDGEKEHYFTVWSASISGTP